MLLHIKPQLFSPFKNVALIDLDLKPFGLHLVGGQDLRTGRPHPNKWYAVGCRKIGKKALDGILVETNGAIDEFSYTARWAIEAQLVVTHSVDYQVLDRDFDAASERMMLWHACSTEGGYWPNRIPQGRDQRVPLVTEPMMEVVPWRRDRRRVSKDVIEGDWIVTRHECFSMPTIERERILQSPFVERIPPFGMAFQLK